MADPQQQTFTDVQPIQQTFENITPIDAAPTKNYLPGRAFGMDVARGMGLDADKIAAAEDRGGQGEGLKEIGSQVLEGLKGVLKDPLSPISGTASNFEEAVKSGSPGRIIGALSTILGGAESTEGKAIPGRAVETTKAVLQSPGMALRDETGALRPVTKAVSRGVGGLVGHATGIPGAEIAGVFSGPSLADALIPNREPTVGKAVPIIRSPNFDPTAYKAGRVTPQGNATPFNQPQPLSSLANPEPSRIVSPESPAPPINKTYVSYPADQLVRLARKGDLNAVRELIRNPRGVDLSQIPNIKYLMEQGRRGVVYGGPTE